MLSRIADSLFWTNRYMERSEGLLRVLHTNYILSLDKGPYGVHSWRPVLEIFSYADEDSIKSIEQEPDAVLHHLLFDSTNNNSLKVIISRARENARGIQDNITKEVWEQANQVYHLVNNAAEKRIAPNQTISQLDELIKNIVLFTGVVDTTMPRGMGWAFMNIGRYIERCLITLEVANKNLQQIDYNLAEQKDILYWRNLLLSLSGYELHLKTYRSNDSSLNVIDQVVFNKDFPRSLQYGFARINKYLADIIEENNPPEKERIIREFGRLNSFIQFADIDLINELTLQQFLEKVRVDLLNFSKHLGQIFFSYS